MAFDPARFRSAIGTAHAVRRTVEAWATAFASHGWRSCRSSDHGRGGECDKSLHSLSPSFVEATRSRNELFHEMLFT
jgi:hypothetical protein